MPDFPLRVSIIVPVYNMERTLARSVRSLLRQTMPSRQMEILLVDDGSTDQSPALCDALARRHACIRVLHQANRGVSFARNAGIRAARGACLMFLDGDDTLHRHTVAHVVAFWEAHRGQVDLVTYPLFYRSEKGHRRPHPRNARFGATGIYPLSQHPFLCQSNMNICIPNRGGDTPRFREDLSVMEDQAFLTGLLLEREAVGFVREAGYEYLRHSGNTSLYLASAFAPQASVLEGFLQAASAHPESAAYLYSLVLYNLDRMLRAGTLFPGVPGSEGWRQARERTAALLAPVPVDLLLRYPFVEALHRFFFLRLKPGVPLGVQAQGDGLALFWDGAAIYHTCALELVITRLGVEDNALCIGGFLRSPLFDFTEKPRLLLSDGRMLPLFVSAHSCYQAREQTNLLWAFDLCLPLKGEITLSFACALSERTLPVRLSYLPGTGLLPETGPPRLLRGGWILEAGEEALAVGRDAASRKRYNTYVRKRRLGLLRRAPHLWGLHLLGRALKRLMGRPWVYIADGEASLGDALAGWRQHPERAGDVPRALVAGPGALPTGTPATPFGGVRHLLLLLRAGRVLSERPDAGGTLPCAEQTFARFSDVWDFVRVSLAPPLKALALPERFAFERTGVDRQLVPSAYEKARLQGAHVPERLLAPGGLPRFSPPGGPPPPRRLLFLPALSPGLAVGAAGEAFSPLRDRFQKSAYYRALWALLSDPALGALLSAHGYTLDLCLPPAWQGLLPGLPLPQGPVRAVPGIPQAGDYRALLTDTSPLRWDFLRLGRAVLHFIPPGGPAPGLSGLILPDFSKEAEGPLYVTAAEALAALSALLGRDGVPQEAQLVRIRALGFF